MSLKRNITFQFITQLFGIISAIIVSIFTARSLGASGRGDLAEFTATLYFLVFFLGLGIDFSVLYHIANKKFNQTKIINTALLFNLLFFFSGILLWGTEYLSGISFLFNHSDYFYGIFILLCFYAISQNAIITAVLGGNKLFSHQQRVSIFTSCCSILLTVLFFLLVVEWNEWGSFKLYLPFLTFVLFFSLALTWYFLRKNLSYSFSLAFLSIKEIRILLSFSFIAYLANVLQYFSYKVDFWIVEYFMGKEVLGNYALAISIARILWILPTSVSSVIVPYSVGGDLQHIIQRNNKIIRTLVFITFMIFIISLPIIDWVILILYGIEFSTTAFIIKFLLLGIIPFSAANIITAFFIAQGKLIHNFIFSILFLFITLVGDFLLIPNFEVKGICASSLLASFVSAIYIFIVYKRYSHVSFREMFCIKKEDFNELIQYGMKIISKNK